MTDNSARHAPLWIAACWLSILAPLVVLVWTAHLCGLDFPWAEDWAFCEVVLKPMYEGQLTWRELCMPLHGYAKFSTWIVRAPLAALTHWNHDCDIALNVLFGIGTLTAALETLRRSARNASRSFPHWLVPVFAFVLLGLDKSTIWLWGDGMTYTLAVFASTCGIAALSKPEPSWPRITFAAAMGAVSTFAFASGVIYLFVSTLVLHAGTAPPRRRRVLAAWCAITIVVAAMFALNTREGAVITAGNPSLLERVGVALLFLPVYLGALLTKFHLPAAGFLGCAGLIAGAVAVWRAFRRQEIPSPALIPMVAFMLFAILSGLAACLARHRPLETLSTMEHGGLLSSASERYPFFAQFYWLGLLGLLWLQLPGEAQRNGLLRRFTFALAGLVLVLSILSSRTGYYEAQERYEFYGKYAHQIVAEDLEAVPERLQWPYGNERRDALKLMRKHALSIFRGTTPSPTTQEPPPPNP